MLDTATKRRIDSARDILVGKVPDPKSQVEQITIALIYKFMDDMDAQSEEAGGKRRFFAKDFQQYAWPKLVRSGLGGQEVLNLYAEAIAKMPENPGIPRLFRDIFKNAFLPYRDPETLRLFLKEIDGFEYDHSERLGDAFEYLLSVLDSQGDAGQFRTPRHIIDFIVSIVDPKKNETVLDPACGTAGFLISAYKHILRANSTPAAIGTSSNGEAEATLHTSKIPVAKGDLLTPDERKKLAGNFRGYDISPDMVRLSLVNMYLHGFTSPNIDEYDALTSQEKWNEMADVILANPPFMSPKGGIKPHKRFSIESKRSEVLFVDYMAEHLTPTGRAGIIVPEGIIFQSQTAYKTLRKMLVEQYLVAVVSLPAGVFNPYSGVKTSILILDKSLAKQSDTVGFFKVENDGFGLGAQRRPIDTNDLPQVLAELNEYLRRLRAKESVTPEEYTPMRGLIAAKEKIAANGDYNLSGERYRGADAAISAHPIVALGDVCEIYQPKTITQQDLKEDGAYVVFGANGVIGRYDQFNHEFAEVIITCRGATCGTVNYSTPKAWITGNAMVVTPKSDALVKDYLFHLLKHFDLSATISGSAQPQITRQSLAPLEIPLPPFEVQKEIVAEIEAYQRVSDGARAVLDHYRPHIPIQPDWPMVELSELCELISGRHVDKDNYNTERRGISYLTGPSDFGPVSPTVSKWTEHPEAKAKRGDILITVKGSGLGSINLLDIEEAAISRQLMAIRVKDADPAFIHTFLLSKFEHFQSLGNGAAIPGISREHVLELPIPFPPMETQRAIVAEIEAERRLVEANRELIVRMQAKIAATLARIWGDEAAAVSASAPSQEEA